MGKPLQLERRSKEQVLTEVGEALIIYWHIPKCGGTSINSAFWNELPEENIFSMRLMNDVFRQWPQVLMNETLVIVKEKVTYIEYHAYGQKYPFLEFANDMKRIRPIIVSKGGNIFVFTVLREPVSAVISLVSYLCNALGARQACEPTAKGVENMQTKFLINSYIPYIRNRSPKNISDVFDDVKIALDETADYVGFTENISMTYTTIQSFIDNIIPDSNVHIDRHSHERENAKRRGQRVPQLDEENLPASQIWDIKLYDYFYKKYNPTSRMLLDRVSLAEISLSDKSIVNYQLNEVYDLHTISLTGIIISILLIMMFLLKRV